MVLNYICKLKFFNLKQTYHQKWCGNAFYAGEKSWRWAVRSSSNNSPCVKTRSRRINKIWCRFERVFKVFFWKQQPCVVDMFEKGLEKAKLNQPSAGVSAKNSVLMESNVQRTSKKKKGWNMCRRVFEPMHLWKKCFRAYSTSNNSGGRENLSEVEVSKNLCTFPLGWIFLVDLI